MATEEPFSSDTEVEETNLEDKPKVPRYIRNKKTATVKEKSKTQKKKKFVFGGEENESDMDSLDRSIGGDSVASDVVENFV